MRGIMLCAGLACCSLMHHAHAEQVCQGGTGAAITSITTTPQLVCAGGSRSKLNIMNTLPIGGATILCAYENTVTLTTSTYDFPVYAGTQTDYETNVTAPQGDITCMCSTGTCTLKATVNQNTKP